MVPELRGWRTILWNVIDVVLTIAVAVAVVLEVFPWDQFVTAKTAAILILVFKLTNAIGNIILRIKTTTPVGKADSDV